MIKYIYAYTGGRSSGKSYLAEELAKKCDSEIHSFAYPIRQLISCTALGNYSVEDLKNGSVKKDSLFLNRDFAAVTKKLEKDFFIKHARGEFGKHYTQKHTYSDMLVDNFLSFYIENLTLIEQECKTIRDYLIYIGELFGKGLHNDDSFWAKILLKEIKTPITETDVLVIDDLRFRSEFEALRVFCSEENIVLIVFHIDNRTRIQKFFTELPKDLKFISKQPETISIKNIF